MKLFSQDDPAERAFQTCGKPCGPGVEGGGWHTSDRIYEANTTSLEQAPRGKLFFLGGHHCLPMLPSLQLYTYQTSQGISFGDHFQTSFLFLIYTCIFFNQIIDIWNDPSSFKFHKKNKNLPLSSFFFYYFIDNSRLGMKKGVN